jgi:hypothetical protein
MFVAVLQKNSPKKNKMLITTKEFNEFPILGFNNVIFNQWR